MVVIDQNIHNALCFYDFCLPAFGLVSCSVKRCCVYMAIRVDSDESVWGCNLMQSTLLSVQKHGVWPPDLTKRKLKMVVLLL